MTSSYRTINEGVRGFNQQENFRNRNFEGGRQHDGEDRNYNGGNFNRNDQLGSRNNFGSGSGFGRPAAQHFNKPRPQSQQFEEPNSFSGKSVQDVNVLINPSWDSEDDAGSALKSVAAKTPPATGKQSNFNRFKPASSQTDDKPVDNSNKESMKIVPKPDKSPAAGLNSQDWDSASIVKEKPAVEKPFGTAFSQVKTSFEPSHSVETREKFNQSNGSNSNKSLNPSWDDDDSTSKLSETVSIPEVAEPPVIKATPIVVHSPLKRNIEENNIALSEERQRPPVRVRNIERTLNHVHSELNAAAVLPNKAVAPFGSLTYDEIDFSVANAINLPDITVAKRVSEKQEKLNGVQQSSLPGGKSAVVNTANVTLQVSIEPDVIKGNKTFPKIVVTALSDDNSLAQEKASTGISYNATENCNQPKDSAWEFITKNEMTEMAKISQKIFDVYGEMNAFLQRLSQR